MQTFIILSSFNEGAPADPENLKRAAEEVKSRVKSECSGVEWKASYVLSGAYDVLDIVESEDPIAVQKAAMLIRSHGNARTESMLATRWEDFLGAL